MRKRLLPGGLCLAAGLLLVPACKTVDSSGSAANAYTADEGSELEQDLGDPTLARDLVIESYLPRRRDGRMHVQFNLRNTRRTNLDFEWTIAWMDSGFILDTPRTWTPAKLGGGDFESISRTAPTSDATGFKLLLRRRNTIR